jgi:hypothetical protein
VVALLQALSEIKEVHVIEGGKKGRPKVHRTLTRRSALQERLIEALDLTRYTCP